MAGYSDGEKYRAVPLFSALPEIALFLDRDMIIKVANQEWRKLFKELHLSAEHIGPGRKFPRVLRWAGCAKDSVEKVADEINRIYNNEQVKFREEIFLKMGDQKKWYELKAKKFMDGVLIIKEDITIQKEKGRMEQSKAQSLFKNSTSAIAMLDREGNIIEINDEFRETFGYNLHEVKDEHLDDVMEWGREGYSNREKTEEILKGKKIKGEDTRYDKNENPKEFLFRGVPIIIDGKIDGAYVMYEDITELKEKEERLRYLSYHDGLTDLYNRSFLEEEMQRLDTKRQLPISIIYCDINGLKIVNDTYGHEMGDKLLRKVADIMRENTRDEDIVARWAGDEFVIFLTQTDIEMARDIVKRLEKSCGEAEFEEIPVSLGIGIAAKNNIGEDLDETLARADERMYKDKLTKANSTENKLVQSMLNTLGAKSAETKEHAIRMTELAHRLGDQMGLTNQQLNKLALLATLHDIGKITISEKILTKPKGLTDKEWQVMKEHPERGYTIATATEEFAPIAREILYHHEHWNGEGYPEGLGGEEIPFLSRIISIVDAYDVMTTGRPYKNPISQEKGLEEIKRCAGSQFDPELAEKFVKNMDVE